MIGPDTTAGTTQGPLSQVVRLSGAGGIGATMVAGPTHHQVGSAVKVSTQACAKRLTLQPVRQIRKWLRVPDRVQLPEWRPLAVPLRRTTRTCRHASARIVTGSLC